jgi:hypothetical protein
MIDLRTLIGKQVDVEVSGKNECKGILIDAGLDILVIYNGKQHLYIPLGNLQNLELSSSPDDTIGNSYQAPLDPQTESVSYRKILDQARGLFWKFM